jgi:hypothetical protein
VGLLGRDADRDNVAHGESYQPVAETREPGVGGTDDDLQRVSILDSG